MTGVGLHKKSKAIVKSHGFTIVETMIVLTITGLLFTLFVLGVNTRQSQAKFRQSINAVRTEIDQRINESQSGQYSNASNFTCTKTPTGPSINSGSAEQGTNDGCVLLGKVLWFDNPSNPGGYTVYPIAGLKGAPDFSASEPKIVGISGVAEPVSYQHGLSFVWMRSGGSSVGAVAFTPSFLSIDDVPVSGSNTTQVRAVENLNKLSDAYVGEVQICFRSGTADNLSGLITIGGGTGNSTVSLSIRGNNTCA